MTEPTQLPSVPGGAEKPAIRDYELLRLIGQGSYGDVWLAQGVTGVFRAVKVVWRSRFNDPHPFEREFKGLKEFTAVSLVEAHQLALLHVGRNDEAGFFYYVMELADDVATGREIDPERYVPLTLREMRNRRGRLPAGDCVALAAELARALAVLHAHNLVHRDIKPSNVVIIGGVPKLADIGLVASATDARTYVGTEGFVPPEGPGAPAADVYSLGKLLYELSTGRDRTEFPSLPQNLDEIPDRKLFLEFNEIVIRACDPSADLRYVDAGEMLEDILLLQAGHSVRRLRFVERRLRESLRLAVILATIAAIAAGGAFVEQKRLAAETERRRQAEAALEKLARKTFYAATLSRGERALETGNFGIARRILGEALPPPGQIDLRDFEWGALWNEAQGDPATVYVESGPALTRVRYSPDGRLLASQTTSGRVTVRETKDGHELLHIDMPNAPYFAGFSDDGRWLLGINDHGALRRWNIPGGLPEDTADIGRNRPLAPLGKDQVVSYCYPRDGGPERIRIWDFAKKSERVSWPIPHTGPEAGTFFSGGVSSDGQLCAIALITGKAHLATWRLVVLDLKTGTLIWDEVTEGRLIGLAFGPRDRTLACGFADPAELRLLDLVNRNWSWRTAILGTPAAVVFLEPNLFCVDGRGRRLQMVAADTGRAISELRGQAGNISDLSADNETGHIVAASDTGEVRAWSRSAKPSNRTFTGFWRAPGREVCVSGDGKLLAATVDGHRVQIINMSGDPDIPEYIEGVLAPIVFSSQHTLWLVGVDGSIQRWLLARNPLEELAIRVAEGGRVLMGACGSRDGHRIVAYDNHGLLSTVDTEKKQVLATTEADAGGLFWTAVSGDGRFVAGSGIQQTVGIWTLPELRLKNQWHSDQRVTNGAFSPDSHILALALRDGTLEFRHTDDPISPVRKTTSSGTAYGLSFHPTEPRLFVGGQDGVLHVFDTTDWTELVQMTATEPGTYPGTIITQAVSADGSTLAAYTESGLIRVWRK